MKDLREIFLVDKLRKAASAADDRSLSVIREIIKEIKLIQIRDTKIASDEMVVEVLESLKTRKSEEVNLINDLLREAIAHTRDTR